MFLRIIVYHKSYNLQLGNFYSKIINPPSNITNRYLQYLQGLEKCHGPGHVSRGHRIRKGRGKLSFLEVIMSTNKNSPFYDISKGEQILFQDSQINQLNYVGL